MKQLTLAIAFILISFVAHSQVQYTVNKVSYRHISPDGKFVKAPFKSISKETIINLYSNALVVTGSVDLYFKLVRKATVTEGSETYDKWNAVDRNGDHCQIAIEDYGNYSTVAILWEKTGTLIVYQTL